MDVAAHGTHTMRRTKASLIYKRTKNLRVVQLLLGYSKLESAVRYLGIEVDEALCKPAISDPWTKPDTVLLKHHSIGRFRATVSSLNY